MNIKKINKKQEQLKEQEQTLTEEKNKLIKQKTIDTLKRTLAKLENTENMSDTLGISVTSFCKKNKNSLIDGTKALQWLDNSGYTQQIDKNIRIVTSKGKKDNYLIDSTEVTVNCETLKCKLKSYPLITPIGEKFLIRLLHKDNFTNNINMLKKKS